MRCDKCGGRYDPNVSKVCGICNGKGLKSIPVKVKKEKKRQERQGEVS